MCQILDKIYIHKSQYWGLMANKDNITKNGIEYIRKDAFIEKACELLARMIWEVTYEDLEGNSVQNHDKMKFIEDFKKYMKGE